VSLSNQGVNVDFGLVAKDSQADTNHSCEPCPQRIDSVRELVYDHYEQHGRNLPWRKTTDPYCILVSEVMLQQTQVDRVAPRYLSFLERFPDFVSLASATPSEVLREWQGLGYNRRALSLQAAARQVVESHGGVLPEDKRSLMSLPGIGSYTASAIRAFAFNQPDAFIETNIREVFIHHFFPEAESVTDAEIMPLVEMAVDRENPRRWYQALMDYGVKLKQQGNASRRSAHHRPQSRFSGSRRQARGEILRLLLASGRLSLEALRESSDIWDTRYEDALKAMLQEGVVREHSGEYGLD